MPSICKRKKIDNVNFYSFEEIYIKWSFSEEAILPDQNRRNKSLFFHILEQKTIFLISPCVIKV